MPCKVSFDKNNDIINVQISGKVTHDDHIAARDEALGLCKKNECYKLLVDLSELNTIRSTTMDCFEFGEELAETTPFMQIAHVLPADMKSRKDIRFTANVEANRGKSSKVFETIDEARKWLLETS